MKILLIIGALSISAMCANAQPLFKHLAPPKQDTTYVFNVEPSGFLAARSTVYTDSLPMVTSETHIQAIRQVSAAAYCSLNNSIMGGYGFGFQDLTYKPETQSWYCNWSVNGLYFAGVTTSTGVNLINGYALLGGVLNNKLLAGAFRNWDGKIGAMVSIGFNFN